MKVVAILLMSLSLALAMSVSPIMEKSAEGIQTRGVEAEANNKVLRELKEEESNEKQARGIDSNEEERREVALNEESNEKQAREIALNEDSKEQERREVGHEMNQRGIAIERALSNSTQCVYNPDTKLFSCRGISLESLVECPAIFEWEGDHSFSLFGLGFADASRYWLYPRSLDNSTYLNHTLLTKGGLRDLFLYFGDKMVEYGFRVTDSSCFERLISLIKVSSVEHISSVEGDLTVPMVGEVLVMNNEVSKRWGFGYGYGLGYGGWGYGGLGMGMYGMYGMYGR